MSSNKRVSKIITNADDLNFIFNSTSEDCTKLSFIMECFGDFNRKQRFHPYDIITVPPGVYGIEGKKNKNSFTTTVGIFVFNRVFIESDPYLFELFKYINKTITKDEFESLCKNISYGVVEDEIPLTSLKRFMQLSQKHMAYVDVLAPSFTEDMMEISSKVAAKRKELMKKYEKAIKEKDPNEVEKMEKELLAYIDQELKDDPSTDMLGSGAAMKKGGNFKNMFGMRGAYKMTDFSKGDFDIITGNYMDGIGPDEFVKFCDSLSGGPYARNKKTQVGGYLEKLSVRAFEHVVTKANTDCKTKRYIEVTLDKKNIDGWMYSYIIEGNSLVELTSKNKDKYLGKKVKLRYSGLCESKEYICNKCAGNLYARLGIENVGIASYAIMSKIKLMSMKAFHDSTIKTFKMSDYGYKKIFGL